ncbi:MAG: hypothetical protein KatS3mg013_1015 [Actinomycetota bacterium]|nr:MAG: hypothetical protein KatS3mg013_1015 [Actinomycetota bacterium]
MIPANRWTLERFGLTPAKLRARALDRSAPKVLGVSIPKAGTHLVERALCLHPRLYRKILPTITGAKLGRGGLDGLLARLGPGEVVLAHLRFDPAYPGDLRRRAVRGVFLVRDPRDVVISQARYAMGRTDHWAHGLFAARADERERLRLAIAGDERGGLRSIGRRLADYAGWLEAPGVLVVRFEDLVGARGGGDPRRQREAVAGLYRHLGLEPDDDLVRRVCERLFSADSPTFRRGTIGQWRSTLDAELLALLEDVAGEQLARYGYA